MYSYLPLLGDVTSYDGISHVDYNERFNFNQSKYMILYSEEITTIHLPNFDTPIYSHHSCIAPV